MKEISGTYFKKEKSIAFACLIPESWAQLSQDQFASCVQILAFRQADPYVVRTSLLASLFDAKNWHILHHLPNELVADLLPLTDFLYSDKPEAVNRFRKIRARNRLIAPADDLNNICFGEWCFAYEFYTHYARTRSEEYSDRLIATLYRPKDQHRSARDADWNGDPRVSFNENLIESRAAEIAKLPKSIKTSIITWFALALGDITAIRPNVFPKVEVSNEDQPEEPNTHGRTWLTLFRELLGPKWGTTDQLKHTNAMFILDELEDRQIEYKETLKKYRK